MPTTITLSGVDEGVQPHQLDQLLQYPSLELGLLYSATPEGRNRYPSLEWLISTAEHATGRCAIHICGRGARAALFNQELHSLVVHAKRIQINGVLTVEEVEQACLAYPTHTIITQHHPRNEHLLQVTAKNHALLVDASGGNGQLPHHWARPKTEKTVGFAGGLGPSNITKQILAITDVAGNEPYWIDMEGQLRRNDAFDINAALFVMYSLSQWSSSLIKAYRRSIEKQKRPVPSIQ